MKLNRFLSLCNSRPHVIDERVLLQLNSPGRAEFLIHSPDHVPEVNKMLSFDFGYSSQDTLQRLFLGFIEKVTPATGHKYTLFCRELSAVLNNPLPLNLRHVNLKQVLAFIQEKTGLNFSVPDQVYSKQKAANFVNLGNGYQAMLQLGCVFNIPDFIWQQQGDGVVYVGSWEHSRWADKTVVIPDNIFSDQTAQNSVKCLAIPALKPGVLINDKRIDSLEFMHEKMTLAWKN